MPICKTLTDKKLYKVIYMGKFMDQYTTNKLTFDEQSEIANPSPE